MAPWRRVLGEVKHDERVTLATFASSSFYRVTELSQLVGNQIYVFIRVAEGLDTTLKNLNQEVELELNTKVRAPNCAVTLGSSVYNS